MSVDEIIDYTSGWGTLV